MSARRSKTSSTAARTVRSTSSSTTPMTLMMVFWVAAGNTWQTTLEPGSPPQTAPTPLVGSRVGAAEEGRQVAQHQGRPGEVGERRCLQTPRGPPLEGEEAAHDRGREHE